LTNQGFTCVCRYPAETVVCTDRGIGKLSGKELYFPDQAKKADFSRNKIEVR
jgi:hypothetical protein